MKFGFYYIMINEYGNDFYIFLLKGFIFIIIYGEKRIF